MRIEYVLAIMLHIGKLNEEGQEMELEIQIYKVLKVFYCRHNFEAVIFYQL